MKTIFPIVSLLLQACIVSSHAQVLSRASYGENCSKDLRCESRNVLTCLNGMCECLMPDTMVFEEASGNCVTLAGERCQYNSVEGETTWTEEVPCISNALCRNGVCECDNVHYEIANGTCLPKLDHGNDCHGDKMCNGEKHLICGEDKKCICSNDRVLSNGICIVLAGRICLPNDTCTERSICSESTGTTLCTCFPNYYQTKNLTCQHKKEYGEDCDGDDQCIQKSLYSLDLETETYFVCSDGKCLCDNTKSILDTSGSCKKYSGQECATDKECVAGATCTGTCQCKADYYEEYITKTCELKRSFGKFCLWNEECQNNLYCHPGKYRCACKQGTEFHPQDKKCVVSVGHMCMKNIYYSSSSPKSCVPKANCGDQYYDSETREHNYKCACTGDTTKSIGSSGYCHIKENGTCDGDMSNKIGMNTCLPGLVCRNKACVCPFKDHQIFKRSTEQCISYVGGPCVASKDCLDENAECASEFGIKQCKCQQGFTQVGRSCDRAYGETCKLDDYKPKCDRFGPLECSAREICECSDFQIYDQATLRCNGLVGAKCTSGGSEWETFCVDGATCKQFRGFRETFGLCACRNGWKTEANRTCSASVSPTIPSALHLTTAETLDNILL